MRVWQKKMPTQRKNYPICFASRTRFYFCNIIPTRKRKIIMCNTTCELNWLL